jgi:hypothetical protein
MNSTIIGTPVNVTVTTPITKEYWLNAFLTPDSFYVSPSNPTATARLCINSSGSFSIRMRAGYSDLYNYFDIRGLNATSWSMPAGYFEKLITVTLKNGTPVNTYEGYVNVTNLEGIPMPQYFRFVIYVSSGIITPPPISYMNVTLYRSPLLLRYNDILSGYVLINITTSLSALVCGLDNIRMDASDVRYANYVPIFAQTYYVQSLRDASGKQYFKIIYQIDNRILNYGNMTIYHYVKVYDLSATQNYQVIMITINVQIKSSLYQADKLWVTVTPNSISGDAGQTKQVTLRVYSNKVKTVYWVPAQSYDSTRPEFVFCVGENYKQTNYSVTVSVVIPQACDVPRTVTFRVYEQLNPSLTNSCVLTVYGTPSSADFMFSIIPLEASINYVGQKTIFRGTVTNKAGNIDTYYLAYKTNATCFDIKVNDVAQSSWFLGTDKEIVFNIHVTLISAVANGSYAIQFTAYTNNLSNYVRRSVIVDVALSKQEYEENIGKTGTTNQTTTTTPLGSLVQIPVVSLNPSVGLRPLIISLAAMTGLNYEGMAFLIGIVFVFIAFILLGKYARSQLLQMLGAVSVIFLNCMLGLWPFFALILIGLLAAGLVSWKIVRSL